jgi:hypothetical protein
LPQESETAFDGGLLSSDGGMMLLLDVERRLGLAELLAGCPNDRRDPVRIDHEMVEMLRLFLIAAGYEDDCDALRADAIRANGKYDAIFTEAGIKARELPN